MQTGFSGIHITAILFSFGQSFNPNKEIIVHITDAANATTAKATGKDKLSSTSFISNIYFSLPNVIPSLE